MNREQAQEIKKQKVQNYMSRWDEYRVRREIVVQALYKVHKRKEAVRFWHALNVLQHVLPAWAKDVKAHIESIKQHERQ